MIDSCQLQDFFQLLTIDHGLWTKTQWKQKKIRNIILL